MSDKRSLTRAVEDHAGELETMKVLQLKLARTIDESNSGRDIAALSRQLREVTAKIAELEMLEDNNDNVLDQIIEKHKYRVVRTPEGKADYE